MTATPASPERFTVLADVASAQLRRTVSSQRSRDAILVTAGILLIALFAQVRIVVGPVPITGQTLAIMLIGSALGARRGLAATALYVGIGLLGAPIFSGGIGGMEVLRGATFGYLLGFIAAAWLVGRCAEAGCDRGLKAVPAYLAAFALPYIPGLAWLAGYLVSTGTNVTLGALLAAGVTPFLASDAIKIAIASILSPLAWQTLARFSGK